MRDELVTPSEAAGALLAIGERQRLLRTAYTHARYGWPESPATAWARRPATFADEPPACRVTRALDALTER